MATATLPANSGTSRPPVERLLTKDEAAKVLGVCSRSIGNFISRGQLRPTKINRLVRIDPDDLREFIERAKAA